MRDVIILRVPAGQRSVTEVQMMEGPGPRRLMHHQPQSGSGHRRSSSMRTHTGLEDAKRRLCEQAG